MEQKDIKYYFAHCLSIRPIYTEDLYNIKTLPSTPAIGVVVSFCTNLMNSFIATSGLH